MLEQINKAPQTYKFIIEKQYESLKMIEAIYFDGFLLLFFGDGKNPVFCYAISSAQGNIKH